MKKPTDEREIKKWLNIVQEYANKHSGCNKVAVGCGIVRNGLLLTVGANRGIPSGCKTEGCHRVQLYGNDSKAHRDPGDCRAIHSEIDAICSAAKSNFSVENATAYVTRYPCESCAKALVAAGIKQVFYGGTAIISQETELIFKENKVECVYIPGWKEDNTDR